MKISQGKGWGGGVNKGQRSCKTWCSEDTVDTCTVSTSAKSHSRLPILHNEDARIQRTYLPH